jgi:hypothetical protein
MNRFTYTLAFTLVASTACSSAFASASTPAKRPPQRHEIVELDGTTWKVTIRGDEARVGPNGLWLYKRLDAHYFASARHAAEIGSGCRATQDHEFRSTVYVELDCKNAQPAKSADREGDGVAVE